MFKMIKFKVLTNYQDNGLGPPSIKKAGEHAVYIQLLTQTN